MGQRRIDRGILTSLWPVLMKDRVTLLVDDDTTVADLAADLNDGVKYAAIVDGKTVHADHWEDTRAGEQVIFSPLPGDIFTAAFWLDALAAAAAGMVISYGVGKILGLDEPEEFEGDTSPTYSFNNLRQTSDAGAPIKVVYGTHPVAGNILELDLRAGSTGDVNSYGSVLDMTVGLCEGEIASIDKITANGNEIELDDTAEGYGSIATPSYNLGTNTQTALGSDGTSTNQTVGLDMAIQFNDGTGGNTVTYTTTQDVDRFRLNILFPQGLYRTDGQYRTQYFRYRYRNTDDDPDAFTGYFYVPVTSRKVGAFMHSILVEPVDATNTPRRGTYEIELRHINWNGSSEDVLSPDHGGGGLTSKFDSVTEIQNQVYAYPNLATLRLVIDAQNSVNGRVPNVVTTVTGRKVQKWDGVSVTNPNFVDAGAGNYSNPAWIVLDLLRNTRYGLGNWVDTSKIDIESFDNWATWCDELVDDGQGGTEKRATWNGVFDGNKSAWDAALMVCASARATLLTIGEMIRVKYEHDRTATQLFTMGNIAEGTWNQSFSSRLERPTRTEVQFLNAANNFQPDVVGVDDPDSLASQLPQRIRTLELPGITRESQALREARFRMNIERLAEVVSFEADIDAIACEPGDVIRVSHDVPAWGESGRVVSAGSSTNTITIDRDVTLDAGITYSIMVRHSSDDSRTTATITSAAGSYTAGTDLTTDTTWTTAPADGDLYALGPFNTYARLISVTGIRTTGDLRRSIEGVVYDPQIHDDAVATATSAFRSLPNDDAIPSAVTRLTARELETDDPQIAISWEYPEGETIGGARIFQRPDSTGVYNLVDTVAWPDSQSIIPARKLARGTGTESTNQYSVVAYSPTGAALAPTAGTTVTHTSAGVGVIPDAVTGIVAEQDDDLLRLKWTAPTNADIARYEIRRGFNWVGSRHVGTTTIPELTTTEWTPTLTSGITEKYLIRPISASDRPGRVASYDESGTLTTWFGGTMRTSDFRAGGAWTGAGMSNLAANSDGHLELVTPGTQAKMESPTYSLGSNASYRVGSLIHVEIEDVTWANASYAWQSVAGAARSWGGYIDPGLWDSVVTLNFRTRTSSSGSWTAWRPLTTRTAATTFEEIQIQVIVDPADTTQNVLIRQAYLVIEVL